MLKLTGVLLRLAVAAGIIAFLLARTGVDRLAEVVADARPGLLGAAFAVIAGGIVVSALRWQVFLRRLGFMQRLGTLVRLYMTGTFFNTFLPTGVGGDVYKALRLRGKPAPFGAALGSAVLERVAGLVGLALIGLLAAGVRLGGGDTGAVVVAAGAVSLGMLGAFAFAVGSPWGPALAFGLVRRVPGLGRAELALRALIEAVRHPRALLAGVGLGLVFQGLVVAFHRLIADALHIDVATGAVACVVVLASVATLLPVTVNGMGVREAVYVWALGSYGVPGDVALAFGLGILALLLAAGAVGGLVYLAGGGRVGS